jgi:serine/threonine-protein kinase RsbW
VLFRSLGVDARLSFSVNLAVEELFTNMVKYNRTTQSDIAILVNRRQRDLAVTLIDRGVEPFDVSTPPAVDLRGPLSRRKVGGLGLHLVRKIVDDLVYEYSDGESKVTFLKHLE